MRKFFYFLISLSCCFVLALSIVAYYIDFDLESLHEGTLEKDLKTYLINKAPAGIIKTSTLVNEAILKAKIAQGLPQFAREQIKNELAKFERIDRSQLLQFFEQYKDQKDGNQLMHIQIKRGSVSVIGPETHGPAQLIPNRDAREIFSDALQYLVDNKYIPADLDLIFWTSDAQVIPGENSVPVFTFAKDLATRREQDLILIPDWMNMRSNIRLREMVKEGIQLYPWENKLAIVMWRGGGSDSTGFRKKIVAMSKQYPQLIDAIFSHKKSEDFLSPTKQLQYKYLVNIDGSRCAWERFVWQLHSNSLVLKHDSTQVQWFYNGVKPYVHYLPIKDEADLLEKIAWAESHPKEVQSIRENAAQFSEQNLTLEDMYHYIIVLLNEYSRKLNAGTDLLYLSQNKKVE